MSDSSGIQRVGYRHRVLMMLMAFWIGGITAYAALVVPAGTSLLGSLDQGLVTRIVTWRFNALGVVVVGALISLYGFGGGWRLRLSCWLMGLIQVGLWISHPWLDGLLDAKQGVVLDEEAFYVRHQVYLWLTTSQILLGWWIVWQLTGWGKTAASRDA